MSNEKKQEKKKLSSGGKEISKRKYEKPELHSMDTEVDFAIACVYCSGPTSCPSYN